ncbi:AraC family transcriptional regulator [Bacteroides sp.]|uniref:helix-turn-helix domain-containing protein n=1 Tax=Bacteroides sp. TaxID=29523 RepID=UPI0025BB8113|nr:helix-turn-helix domain-containing protein [Bacteroides sp.]
MVTELNNIIDFNKFIGLSVPKNKDFEISRLEDLSEAMLDNVPPFRHRLYSVCLAEELDMELNIGYYKRNPQVPYLLFKSPFQIMSWRTQPGLIKGWHFLFTEDFLLKYTQLTEIVCEFPFLQLDKAIPFEIDTKNASQLAEIFRKINNEYESDESDRFELIASYIHVLLVHIRRLYDKSLQTEKELLIMAKESDLTLFNKFKDLLNTQIKEDETLPENSRTVGYYADLLFVHPNYLNAVVKRVTGSTALGLIHEQVITLAKILLLHTELTIKEIAFRLSFSEATHFGTFFKKYTDQTPAEFRKEVQI